MKSPNLSYEEKIQDKVNRLWRSWRNRYDYPDHFEYFVPHRIYDLVLSEARKARNEERYKWLNQPHNEHDKAVRKDTLEAVERGLPKNKGTGTGGLYNSGCYKGFNEAIDEVLSLISSMKGGKNV